MNRKDVEKLLGGYATGTLTAEERVALFGAALNDQTLFNALADEQALKELLDDPRARQRLLEALDARERLDRPSRGFLSWFQRPSSWALAGSLAVAVLAVTLLVRQHRLPDPEPTIVADAGKQAPAPPAAPPDEPHQEFLQQESKQTTDRHDRLTPPATSPTRKRERQGLTSNTPAAKKPPDVSIPGATSGDHRVPASRDERRSGLLGHTEYKQGHARELFYGRSALDKTPPSEGGAPRQSLDAMKSDAPDRLTAKGAAESPAPASSKPDPQITGQTKALGIRYSLLKQAADGAYVPVAPGTTFGAKESARLSVEVNEPAYLYVMAQVAGGTSTLLFPENRENPEAARVEKGTRYAIPSSGVLSFTEPSGDRSILLLLSRQPRPDVQDFLSPLPPDDLEDKAEDKADESESVLEISRQDSAAASVLREEVEQAVYVVDSSATPSSTLLFEITLVHR